MKILTAQQISALEATTIRKRSISEIDLVKEAGEVLAKKILSEFHDTTDFYFFCGNGKNGADGLVCAQQLSKSGRNCKVYILNISPNTNLVFSQILEEIDKTNVSVNYINNETNFPEIPDEAIIIDSIIGTGLNRPIEGVSSTVIQKINSSNRTIISVDLPSGMTPEKEQISRDSVKANVTYTFELPKLNLLLEDNYRFVGEWQILPIRLDRDSLEETETRYDYLDVRRMKEIRKSLNRPKFSRKTDFGHTLIIGGSRGMIGAAILSAKSALKSGSGLVSVYIPGCGYEILQSTVPEAIVISDKHDDHITDINIDLNRYTSIAIGPGLGEDPETQNALNKLLERINTPIVVDADALNILSKNRTLIEKLPKLSVLTPHHKEFDQLVGVSTTSNSRLENQIIFSTRYEQIVVLKGAYTSISVPENFSSEDIKERVFFNSTGNPGMSTAGSGDVLTGIIAGLIAQGLTTLESSLLGVFIHGLAGDKARNNSGEISMTAGEIIENLRI